MNYKSCPFCGSSNLSVESLHSAWNEDEKEAHIVCNECASSSPVYIWNIRKNKGSLANKQSGKQLLSGLNA